MTSDGDDLPISARVVRYVPYARMRRDEDDIYLGPLPSAFEERPVDDYLSVTWCEYYDGLAADKLGCAIEAIRGSNMNVKAKACFCVAEAVEVLNAIGDAGGQGRVIYHPEDDNEAHAGIYGISPDEAQLLARLADETWRDFLTKEDADALPKVNCVKSPFVE